VHTHSVEDLEQLFDQHACVAGICTRRSHRQNVLLSPADVASSAAELATLIAVRDCLTERKFRMLEMEPTPRFESLTDAPKPWKVRFEAFAPSGATAIWNPNGLPKRPWWKVWATD
jgi:hypothetical protein